MTNHENWPEYDDFRFLEIKATQTRRTLLGSLLLAKDTWRDVLLKTPEGLRVLETVEKAEEEFIDPTITDPIARLDTTLTVINDRARAVVVLIDYISKFASFKSRSA